MANISNACVQYSITHVLSHLLLHVIADVEATDTILPVTYHKFADMMEPGDNIYIGRYLVSGADKASLYLEVRIIGGHREL